MVFYNQNFKKTYFENNQVMDTEIYINKFLELYDQKFDPDHKQEYSIQKLENFQELLKDYLSSHGLWENEGKVLRDIFKKGDDYYNTSPSNGEVFKNLIDDEKPNFTYQTLDNWFKGNKLPSRPNLIVFCIWVRFSLEETNDLLQFASKNKSENLYGILSASNLEDTLARYCLIKRCGVRQYDQLLRDYKDEIDVYRGKKADLNHLQTVPGSDSKDEINLETETTKITKDVLEKIGNTISQKSTQRKVDIQFSTNLACEEQDKIFQDDNFDLQEYILQKASLWRHQHYSSIRVLCLYIVSYMNRNKKTCKSLNAFCTEFDEFYTYNKTEGKENNKHYSKISTTEGHLCKDDKDAEVYLRQSWLKGSLPKQAPYRFDNVFREYILGKKPIKREVLTVILLFCGVSFNEIDFNLLQLGLPALGPKTINVNGSTTPSTIEDQFGFFISWFLDHENLLVKSENSIQEISYDEKHGNRKNLLGEYCEAFGLESKTGVKTKDESKMLLIIDF